MIPRENYKERGFTQAKIEQMYFKEISKSEFIGKEEEQALSKRILKGDGRAINQLVESHLVFVVMLARRLKGRGVALLDLIQEGNIGLLTAAKKFDYRRGARFKTHAFHWIMQAMLRLAVKKKNTVNPATQDQLSQARVAKVLGRAKHQNRGYLTEQEIAELTGLSLKNVKRGLSAKVLLFPILSKNEARDARGERRGLTEDDISAPDAPDPDRDMLVRDVIKSFFKLGREFSETDLAIIYQYYIDAKRPGEIEQALNVSPQKINQVLSQVKKDFQDLYIVLERHFKEKSLTEVGRDYEVSRERIRQIQANAERDMHYHFTASELEGEFSRHELEIFHRLYFEREKISALAKENDLTNKEIKELKRRILASFECRRTAKTS
ncbi:sigma-70 family RNA polymerase sigma factor [Patescibacteria group bacterium]|nr:sigma-70 family RNA polymerase sigma factor [Patescibacteria group bacterium]MBU1921648.1 sigma-70 family RNA polymerase sigma factor [Patescibacteria group bacterium]